MNLLSSRAIPWVEDLALFFFRLLLSYGFYAPFVAKVAHFDAFSKWLERMHFSFPILNAWLVICLQGAAVVLLVLGAATRLLSAALLFHMVIGLLSVHWPNGFSATNNGYEIPLYYCLMLLTLVIRGAGRWSIDQMIRQRLICH